MKVLKLQRLKGKYEMNKMDEDENITSFMQKVNELVLNIRCASGVLEESEIVANVFRSLTPTYKHRVATIEEIWTVIDVTIDMLIRKIASFKLSNFGEVPPKSKSSFKATTSEKQKYDL